MFALAKKFTPADQLGWAAEEYLVAAPTHHLRAARSLHVHRGVDPAGSDCGYCGGTGASPGRLRFSNTAFVESHLNVVLTLYPNKLHIDAVLEIMVTADLGAFRLPCRSKLLHDDNVVRIAHGDRST